MMQNSIELYKISPSCIFLFIEKHIYKQSCITVDTGTHLIIATTQYHLKMVMLVLETL